MRHAAEKIGLRHLCNALASLMLCACGEAARPPSQPAPVAADIASFCAEFRTQAEAIAALPENESAAEWPVVLPGMAPLAMSPAPEAVTSALLGPPCPGGDDLWAVRSTHMTGNLVDVEQEILAVSAPSIITLGDGRTAFFAIASEGHYHAADAFGLIAFVDNLPLDTAATRRWIAANPVDQAPLFAMPGGGTWGEAGGFNVPPSDQAAQIWSAAGDVSFGDVQGWAGVTDVSGEAPRVLGRFLTYGRNTCAEDDGAPCTGAWEYVVTSIVHAPGGQITLRWRLQAFAERRGGTETHRSDVRTRDLSATYQLTDGAYHRLRGEEPPKLD